MMDYNSNDKKRPYTPPVGKEVSPETAKQFVVDRANCSDQEAENLLELLRREQQKNERRQNDADEEERDRRSA